MSKNILKEIEDQKLIGLVKVTQSEDVMEVVDALREGGVQIIQIAETVPSAYRTIETLAKESDLTVGIGNVFCGEDAQRAINAGVDFISSPFTTNEIITVAKNSGTFVIQGVSTLTEAVEAHNLGADLIKIFPIDTLGGPQFVQRVRATLPFIKPVVHGRVGLGNSVEYLKSGAMALCLGSSLVEKSWVRSHDWSAITQRAKEFATLVDASKITR